MLTSLLYLVNKQCIKKPPLRISGGQSLNSPGQHSMAVFVKLKPKAAAKKTNLKATPCEASIIDRKTNARPTKVKSRA